MKVKYLLLILVLAGCKLITASYRPATPWEKAVKPTPHSVLRTPHSTRAVVVGISDYLSPEIPDLRFAHRDAEAFAAWLQSPAGGSVPDNQLRLLTNEKATIASVIIALDWLLENSQPDDQVIIYFAGHGDVENKTVKQTGYLLCWDAPPRVYMAGGGLSLEMLNDVVTTLSEQNKTKVLLVTDASHAGKLQGNDIGGVQITNANLARQYANETKILSCQPDEFSLEGEQWGGGRSAFSWRLLQGLYGLADIDRDGSITLKELSDYLSFTVPNDAAPHRQTPMAIGNRNTVISRTDPELSALLQYRNRELLPGDTCVVCHAFLIRLKESIQANDGTFDWLIRRPELTPFGNQPAVMELLSIKE